MKIPFTKPIVNIKVFLQKKIEEKHEATESSTIL
jgi:hypothetical protein